MKFYPSLFHSSIAFGYLVVFWSLGLATYSKAEQKAEAATSSTSQQAGRKSKLVEISSLSDFTLSYSRISGLPRPDFFLSGSLQPDGKLALKMEKNIFRRGESFNTEWTAVASPELKDRLLEFVREQLQMRGYMSEIILRKQPAQDSERSHDQPKDEDAAKRIERLNAEMEEMEKRRKRMKDDERKLKKLREEAEMTGPGGVSLSITFREGEARTIDFLVDREDSYELLNQAYASTRSKADQENDKQKQLVWEEGLKKHEREQEQKYFDRLMERRKEEERLNRIKLEQHKQDQIVEERKAATRKGS